MGYFRQSLALGMLGLSEIPSRKGASAVTALGVGAAVAVLTGMLAMGNGVRSLAVTSARSDRVVIRANGGGSLSRDQLGIIAAMPQLEKSADGVSAVSGELDVSVRNRRRSDDVRVDVRLMGVDERFFRVHPEFHLTEGRMFHPGLREIVVGSDAYGQYRDLGVGQSVRFRNADWSVVGHFRMGGIADNAMIADVRALTPSGADPEFNQVTAVLSKPMETEHLAQALDRIPTLNVSTLSEERALGEDVAPVARTMNAVSYIIGGLMALGAVLGAANTMYSTIDARRRELVTLRAIGYAGASVVTAVIIEALVLATVGASVGIVCIIWFFNGLRVAQVGYVFPLTVTLQTVAIGVLCAMGIGFIGGLVPAVRTARSSIVEAMRAT